MSTTYPSKSAEVRSKLDHPVIDSDGHMIEFEPGFLDWSIVFSRLNVTLAAGADCFVGIRSRRKNALINA